MAAKLLFVLTDDLQLTTKEVNIIFIFEKLIVYQKSLDLSHSLILISSKLENRAIKDQLSRAALSIPLNIAEGQGRMHKREKRQFYNTAKGSLFECLPLVQLCHKLGFVCEDSYAKAYLLMEEVGRMLSGLIKSVENMEDRD